jgi:hypothetical protein
MAAVEAAMQANKFEKALQKKLRQLQELTAKANAGTPLRGQGKPKQERPPPHRSGRDRRKDSGRRTLFHSCAGPCEFAPRTQQEGGAVVFYSRRPEEDGPEAVLSLSLGCSEMLGKHDVCGDVCGDVSALKRDARAWRIFRQTPGFRICSH